ncbi:polyhydroxyalkanoate granule-associated phasin [Ideonella sp. BN130291]|uniref:polyhydroxyalkanoate granule-associated phasin n=1 Tax=Ideonella sp. BN130291 TaxID=3112940 RepID=UPI002E266C26|nr:polyhydroxyalkanoate granule-associated phasin [Ideonella sp. BN130291]
MNTRDSLAWARHGTTLFEMALAAPQVITHRSLRMLAAGAQPNARDRREFHRMGQEKLDAFSESMMAMGVQLWRMQHAAAQTMFQSWLQLCATPWRASAWPDTRAWAATSSRALSGLLGTGMKPAHRRVTANARRLARVKLAPPKPR